MGGGYDDSLKCGTCSSDSTPEKYSSYMTTCSMEALRHSYEYANGMHN
jgi:hypothetical protein